VAENGISRPSGAYCRGWDEAHSLSVSTWGVAAPEAAGHNPGMVSEQMMIVMIMESFNRFAHLRAFA
jgi:hypothetical protein